MQEHPFTTTIWRRWTVGSLMAVVWLTAYGLLRAYTGLDWEAALVDSLLSSLLFFAAAYLYWPIAGSLSIIPVLILLAFAIQGGWIAFDFALLRISGAESVAEFMPTIPFRLLFGLLGWTILALWYDGLRREEEGAEINLPREAPTAGEEAVKIPETVEWLDRISVKDGARIHLIPLEELWYLQAGGDYVTLATPSGQYVKEQTLKYFETHLPPTSFVRIHRSCIVQVQQILRVELFGKENYQVKLKCGVSLRASLSGYKLLKERLCL